MIFIMYCFSLCVCACVCAFVCVCVYVCVCVLTVSHMYGLNVCSHTVLAIPANVKLSFLDTTLSAKFSPPMCPSL